MQRYITYIAKENFLPAFYKAYTKAITPKNVCAEFKTTRLVLFNLNTIILQLNIALVIRTLSLFPDLLGFPWGFKTSSNIIKAVF
jgi:hypothetical protein